MEHAFLDVDATEIARRVREAASAAAGAAVEVRVSAEGSAFRNIGVALPRARRTRLETRNLRIRVGRALEAIGVTMYPAGVAPRVGGDLEGSVQVRRVELGGAMDAAGLAAPPPARAHVVGR